ncbi:hypothetical protein RRF57_009582 [Xylaria bambusicola]|uniref:Uncharacterized protein n=1 Tax=Xylaria bambusicola TaxID=326684 RepID=A0AAN7UZL7_9PEZI
MASETWSQILSGWPSPTDSDWKRGLVAVKTKIAVSKDGLEGIGVMRTHGEEKSAGVLGLAEVAGGAVGGRHCDKKRVPRMKSKKEKKIKRKPEKILPYGYEDG